MLSDAAATLRNHATELGNAVEEYRQNRRKIVWTGPGQEHLDAYHKPSLDWLLRMQNRLLRAISALERAEADLVRRLGQLRTDEERVRAELPRHFERLNNAPSLRETFRLPEPGDPRWADLARTIVGHSATGRR